MRYLWPARLLSLSLLCACSESDLNIPDPHSMGISKPLIEVATPVSGSVLPADTPFVLEYAVVRGENGDHVTIRVDKQKPETIIRLRASHYMAPLPAGPHAITITEYTRQGRATGGQVTINITMQ